ncbi:hypothetical protein LEP3755_34050 [Leptolyngbya sp. NIES-3755]|nr:hypothetical protein LEP3755_34050 [Leptolyngbya sp. NIES-3755]
MNEKRRGRNSKCTPELIERFCKVLLETGSIKDSCEACGIDTSTYWRWREKDVNFHSSIETALAERLNRASKPIWNRREVAESYVDDVLAGRKFRIKRRQVLSKSGEIIDLVDEEQVIPSDALLERVLGARQEESNTSFQVSFGLAEPPQEEEDE